MNAARTPLRARNPNTQPSAAEKAPAAAPIAPQTAELTAALAENETLRARLATACERGSAVAKERSRLADAYRSLEAERDALRSECAACVTARDSALAAAGAADGAAARAHAEASAAQSALAGVKRALSDAVARAKVVDAAHAAQLALQQRRAEAAERRGAESAAEAEAAAAEAAEARFLLRFAELQRAFGPRRSPPTPGRTLRRLASPGRSPA